MIIVKISTKKLLLVLIFFHIGVNVLWQFVNNSPPSWDAANHTTIAIQIAQSLRNLQFLQVLSVSDYYPTFVHTFAAIEVLIFGPSIKLIQMTGTVFFVASMIGLYLYATAITSKRRISLVAVAIFSFCPIVFDQSRRMMLDIPLTSMVVFSLYFLHQSKDFVNRKHTYLFSVAVGLLLLTKWTGLIFLFVPFVITLFHFIRSKRMSHTVVLDLTIGLMIVLAIAAPWYVTNAKNLAFLSGLNLSGESSDPSSLFSVVNFFYYIKMIANYVATPLIALCLLVSSVVVLFSREKYRWSLFGVIGFSYLVFTFVGNKDPRYIMPLVPFISLLVAVGLEILIIKSKRVGLIVSSLVLGVSFLSFLLLTVRPAFTEGLITSIYVPGVSWVNLVDINDSVAKRYQINLWPDSLVVREVSKNLGSTVVVYESEYFNPSTLQMYLVAHAYSSNSFTNFIITPDIATLTALYNQTSFPDEKTVSQYLSQSRYLVVGRSGTGVEYARNKIALEQVRTYVNTRVGCEKYQYIVSPEGSSCTVPAGTVLVTSSDISIEGVSLPRGAKTLVGPKDIMCPYGCSFQITQKDPSFTHFLLSSTVVLPTGDLIDIYERVY
jgi:4-amino-4-deoxy-L-arabinose transferase-like glycosyltransferase